LCFAIEAAGIVQKEVVGSAIGRLSDGMLVSGFLSTYEQHEVEKGCWERDTQLPIGYSVERLGDGKDVRLYVGSWAWGRARECAPAPACIAVPSPA